MPILIQNKKLERPEHWPTLNTVIMVEKALRGMVGSIIKIAELKRALPKQVNHNTLIVILKYLEESNKILVTLRGITWIYNASPKLRAALNKGLEI